MLHLHLFFRWLRRTVHAVFGRTDPKLSTPVGLRIDTLTREELEHKLKDVGVPNDAPMQVIAGERQRRE